MNRIYLSSPHMGNQEFAFVKEAFKTNWIAPVGPHLNRFEEEFCQEVGSTNAAAVSSGTAALHLALQLCGVGIGDEVVCSTLTFVASVNPIVQLGGIPVLVDSDESSWNMDPQLLREVLTRKAVAGKKPKAVVVVHLYGQSADLDPILDACEEFEVPLIEDAAGALGATYYTRRGLDAVNQKADEAREREDGAADRVCHEGVTKAGALWANKEQTLKSEGSHGVQVCEDEVPEGKRGVAVGSLGRFGIYSFNGNKIITTSGGGMLVSDETAMIERAHFLATQARGPAPHYENSEAGYNYRMSNVLAGIGRGQLQVLSDRVNARRRVFTRYKDELASLPGVAFMPETEFGRSNCWLSSLTIDPQQSDGVTRETMRSAMEQQNIEVRPIWKPMHQQPLLNDVEICGGEVSNRLFEFGLCLPSGSNLSDTEIQRVIACFRAQWNQS